MSPSKTERLLDLVAFLLQERRPVSLAEIREKVVGYDGADSESAIARRFERDKAALIEMGIRLEYIAADAVSEGGYLLDRRRCFLPTISLSGEEQMLLGATSQLAPRPAEGEWAEHLFWAIQKLLFDMPSVAPKDPARSAASPAKRASGADPKRLSLLYTLARAAAIGTPVKFVYFSIGSDETKPRTVHPYGLATYRGAWYLVGFCVDAGEARTFKTGRIQGTVRVGKAGSFRVPSGFSLGAHVGPSSWSRGDSSEGEEVTVAFAPTVSWMARRELGRGRSWALDSGWVAFRFVCHDRGRLTRWLLALAPFVAVLEPDDFAREFRNQLTRMKAIYEETA